MGKTLKTNLDDLDNVEISLEKLSANSFNFKLLMDHLSSPSQELTNEVMILLYNFCESFQENIKLVKSFFDDVLVVD